MARASTHTLLPLDRYAEIMGIPPPHFNSGYGGEQAGGVIVFPIGPCGQVWWQYPWQTGDQISREDLAREIARAESDLAEALGYWPAPRWCVEELHRAPVYFEPNVLRAGFLDTRGQRVGIRARWGKVIAPGQRQADEEELGVTVDYDDLDSDGFEETATVSVAVDATNVDQVQVFFAGRSGVQEWEVRPARTKAISGGTFTGTFWSWQLVDPDLWEAFPVGQPGRVQQPEAINIDLAASRVTTVDVYRVYNDTTAQSAEFYWEPEPQDTLLSCWICGGAGCEACSLTTQAGCLHIRDANLGIVVPQPATYSAADGEWEQDSWTVCADPELVKIWYYSGDISERYLADRSLYIMREKWARAISWMATARLERPLCQCGNMVALSLHLREDLARTDPTRSYQVPFSLLDNPFGTRRGEVEAWKLVDSSTHDKVSYVTAI